MNKKFSYLSLPILILYFQKRRLSIIIYLMRIIVTGGAGFIGSYVVDLYVKEGHTVLVIDNLSTGRIENVNKDAYFEKVDLREREKLIKLVNSFKPDIVNHHAFISSVRVSEENPEEFLINTLSSSLNILEVSKKYISQFIFASSAAVYGEGKVPFRETDRENPINPYGISKLTVEKMVKYYSKKFKFKHTILRYSNVYGPRQIPVGESGVVAIFMEKITKNKPITIFGDGTNTRDFIFVEDVAEANVISLGMEGTFNISTGIETSIAELAQKIEKVWGRKVEKIFLKKENGVKRNSLDPTLSNKMLGFSFKTSLIDGIKKTLEYYEKI